MVMNHNALISQGPLETHDKGGEHSDKVQRAVTPKRRKGLLSQSEQQILPVSQI